MRASLVSALFALIFTCSGIFAQNGMAERPDRAALARAAQANSNSVAAWTAYAEFLDRYGDPGARDAYTKLLAAAKSSGNTARTAAIEHRLKLYEMLGADGTRGSIAQSWPTAPIPGPIRSFARM